MENAWGSPSHVVVRGDGATVAALGAFGFTPLADADGAVALGRAGDRGRGRILVDPAARPAQGPLALDVYTTDLDALVGDAARAGWSLTGRAPIEIGPLVMHQAMLAGPGDLRVVAIEANMRRPSLLDTHPAARVSELHSVVWQVDDEFDAALAFWRDGAGLSLAFDAPVTHPGVATVMGLADGAGVRMAMLSDAAQSPSRFELFAHLADAVPAPAGAIAALAFTVSDLASATEQGCGVAFTISDEARPWAVRKACAVAAGGVVFELWEAPRR